MTSYLPYITGGGGALVVLVLWVAALLGGQVHTDREFSRLDAENVNLRLENDSLRAALDAERRSASDVARAGSVTNQLIAALTAVAAEHKQVRPPDITPEDLGILHAEKPVTT